MSSNAISSKTALAETFVEQAALLPKRLRTGLTAIAIHSNVGFAQSPCGISKYLVCLLSENELPEGVDDEQGMSFAAVAALVLDADYKVAFNGIGGKFVAKASDTSWRYRIKVQMSETLKVDIDVYLQKLELKGKATCLWGIVLADTHLKNLCQYLCQHFGDRFPKKELVYRPFRSDTDVQELLSDIERFSHARSILEAPDGGTARKPESKQNEDSKDDEEDADNKLKSMTSPSQIAVSDRGAQSAQPNQRECGTEASKPTGSVDDDDDKGDELDGHKKRAAAPDIAGNEDPWLGVTVAVSMSIDAAGNGEEDEQNPDSALESDAAEPPAGPQPPESAGEDEDGDDSDGDDSFPNLDALYQPVPRAPALTQFPDRKDVIADLSKQTSARDIVSDSTATLDGMLGLILEEPRPKKVKSDRKIARFNEKSRNPSPIKNDFEKIKQWRNALTHETKQQTPGFESLKITRATYLHVYDHLASVLQIRWDHKQETNRSKAQFKISKATTSHSAAAKRSSKKKIRVFIPD